MGLETRTSLCQLLLYCLHLVNHTAISVDTQEGTFNENYIKKNSLYFQYDHSRRSENSAMPMFMVYTREAIFLIFGLCAGIPALAWALRVLLLHVRGGGRVSIFIIFLLLSGAVEFFLIPFIVTLQIRYEFPRFAILAFTGTRLCGLCFHQLVALESILSLRHPHCFTRLSSPLYSITICLAIWICTCTVFLSIDLLLSVVMAFLLLAVAVAASFLTCVLTATASCSSRTGLHVLAVAVGTLWFLNVPFIVWFCLWLTHLWRHDYIQIYGSMCFCIMTFRLVADPLLCVLVCRGVPRTEAPPGIELNTVQTSD